jgi:hypothetical protein
LSRFWVKHYYSNIYLFNYIFNKDVKTFFSYIFHTIGYLEPRCSLFKAFSAAPFDPVIIEAKRRVFMANTIGSNVGVDFISEKAASHQESDKSLRALHDAFDGT